MGVRMSHYYSALNAVEKAVVGVAVEFVGGINVWFLSSVDVCKHRTV